MITKVCSRLHCVVNLFVRFLFNGLDASSPCVQICIQYDAHTNVKKPRKNGGVQRGPFKGLNSRRLSVIDFAGAMQTEVHTCKQRAKISQGQSHIPRIVCYRVPRTIYDMVAVVSEGQKSLKRIFVDRNVAEVMDIVGAIAGGMPPQANYPRRTYSLFRTPRPPKSPSGKLSSPFESKYLGTSTQA